MSKRNPSIASIRQALIEDYVKAKSPNCRTPEEAEIISLDVQGLRPEQIRAMTANARAASMVRS